MSVVFSYSCLTAQSAQEGSERWESVRVLPLKVVENNKGNEFLNKFVTLESVSSKAMEIEENRAERDKPPHSLGLLVVILTQLTLPH